MLLNESGTDEAEKWQTVASTSRGNHSARSLRSPLLPRRTPDTLRELYSSGGPDRRCYRRPQSELCAESCNWSGLVLQSKPGSILASASGLCTRPRNDRAQGACSPSGVRPPWPSPHPSSPASVKSMCRVLRCSRCISSRSSSAAIRRLRRVVFSVPVAREAAEKPPHVRWLWDPQLKLTRTDTHGQSDRRMSFT